MTEPVRRVHFFTGQLLTPDDLQAEQDYHRRMRYLHNRLLGHGVVDGLDVSAGDDSTVVVSPGLAIDPCGREIVVVEEVRIPVPAATSSDASLDVVATWAEEPDGYVASLGVDAEEPSFTRWLERPDLALVPTGESPEDAVLLARLTLTAEATHCDHSPRRTWPARTQVAPAPSDGTGATSD